MARSFSAGSDVGTNNTIVSEAIDNNELQVWFIAEQVQ
jgi:hypothetical protein